MVTLKRKTFEDLVGNVADDAKEALDEILERRRTNSSMKGEAGRGASDVATADTVGDLSKTVGPLATLPQQMAELTQLTTQLLTAVEALSGALRAIGEASQVGKMGD